MTEELTKKETAVARQPINIDFEKGIVPKNYNELLQF